MKTKEISPAGPEAKMTGTCLVCSLSRNLLSHPQKYHHGAARSAQKWAEQCRLLTHDTAKGRWVDNYGACGQNIFVSTQKVPWWEREMIPFFLKAPFLTLFTFFLQAFRDEDVVCRETEFHLRIPAQWTERGRTLHPNGVGGHSQGGMRIGQVYQGRSSQ